MGSNWVIIPLLGQRVFPLHLGGLSDQQAATLGMSTLLASRGVGAIFGAVLAGSFAGTNVPRLRRTILAAFLMGAVGYLALGRAGSLLFAALALVLAHCGGSASWTASTTLLQQFTEDRFRGRVFSAEFAFTMLVLSVSSFTAGRLADLPMDPRTLAMATGALMLVPALAWLAAGRAWRA